MTDKTPDEVAAIFQVERSWLMRRLPELPHWRAGNKVRFTDEHIEAIREKFTHQPKASDSTGLAPRSATRRRRAS